MAPDRGNKSDPLGLHVRPDIRISKLCLTEECATSMGLKMINSTHQPVESGELKMKVGIIQINVSC